MRDRFLAALALATLALAGCKKEIYHGLSEPEANDILIALAERHIAADKLADAGEGSKKGPQYLIAVDEADLIDAEKVLKDQQLPRAHEPGLMDVFGAQGFIPTDVELKARYLAALQGELAESLKKVPGVVDASVHLVLPESNPLEAGKDLTQARAAVLVTYRESERPGPAKEADELKRERDKLRSILDALNDDLRELRARARDLRPDVATDSLDFNVLKDFFTDARTKADAEAMKAKLSYERLAHATSKRQAAVNGILGLKKVEDLGDTLAQIHGMQVGPEGLPMPSAQIRSLVARATPRLSDDDVDVEYAKAPPQHIRERTAAPIAVWWLKADVVLGLAATTAILAVGLIIGALYLASLRKQLALARRAAAEATARQYGGSMAGGVAS